jgi:hypothetical protein
MELLKGISMATLCKQSRNNNYINYSDNQTYTAVAGTFTLQEIDLPASRLWKEGKTKIKVAD